MKSLTVAVLTCLVTCLAVGSSTPLLVELPEWKVKSVSNQKVNLIFLLKSEIDFIQNYMKLQRLRIVNNEHININVHGIVSNQKIRPLLLISFIENAFKYGTDFKGNTEVSIKIYVKEDEIQFTCMNLIGNRDKDSENSGIGLRNTQERLLLLYSEKHWLTVKEENNKVNNKDESDDCVAVQKPKGNFCLNNTKKHFYVYFAIS